MGSGIRQAGLASADPSAFFQSQSIPVISTTLEPLAAAPSANALITTVIHVDIYAGTSGSAEDVEMDLQEGSSCAGVQIGTYFQIVNPPGLGMTDISLDPDSPSRPAMPSAPASADRLTPNWSFRVTRSRRWWSRPSPPRRFGPSHRPPRHTELTGFVPTVIAWGHGDSCLDELEQW